MISFEDNVILFAFSDGDVDLLSWKTFIAPFHGEIWLSLISISLGTTIILWTLHTYPKRISSKEIVSEKMIENVEKCDTLKL